MVMLLLIQTTIVKDSNPFYTKVAVDQWKAAYSAIPRSNSPYYTNTTPPSGSWETTACAKYTSFDASIREYHKIASSERDFLNYALAVAFTWESWVCD